MSEERESPAATDPTAPDRPISEAEAKALTGPGPRLWQRLIPLALLGSAVALVIIQLTNAISHEATLELRLEAQLARSVSRLELLFFEEGEPGGPVSVSRYNFDSQNMLPTPMTHVQSLPNGRYEILIKIQRRQQPIPLQIKRSLEVVGDVYQRIKLP